MTSPAGMSNHSVSHGTEQRLDTAEDGITKVLPPGTTVIVGKVSYSPADLLTLIQGVAAPFKARRDAHAALRALALTAKQDQAKAIDTLADLRAGLVTALGRDSQGISPHPGNCDAGHRPHVQDDGPRVLAPRGPHFQAGDKHANRLAKQCQSLGRRRSNVQRDRLGYRLLDRASSPSDPDTRLRPRSISATSRSSSRRASAMSFAAISSEPAMRARRAARSLSACRRARSQISRDAPRLGRDEPADHRRELRSVEPGDARSDVVKDGTVEPFDHDRHARARGDPRVRLAPAGALVEAVGPARQARAAVGNEPGAAEGAPSDSREEVRLPARGPGRASRSRSWIRDHSSSLKIRNSGCSTTSGVVGVESLPGCTPSAVCLTNFAPRRPERAP